MPRPSTNDSTETSSTSNPNTSLVANGDLINSNSSPDYHRQSSTPTRFLHQTSLSSTLSDDNTSNVFSSSMQEQTNDTTTSSSNSIPISRNNAIELNNPSNSMQTDTTPNISPIQSLQSTPGPTMEDKSIQCINDTTEYASNENSMEENREQTGTSRKIYLVQFTFKILK